jgi:phosphoribosyl-ATP pyrophosphohydrolase/phosphoribosyl-AMP cyclohydrolase
VNQIRNESDVDRLDFAKGGGLVTVVTQDATSGVVLMVAHADAESLALTLRTREMHYRSRSRGLWRKGATSGNVQHLVSLSHDCDSDAVLARVTVDGPACHEGRTSCFGDHALAPDAIAALDVVIEARACDAHESSDARTELTSGSYTRRLLGDRNLRLKKIGEECAEVVTALADGDADRSVEEAADVVYHLLVALRATGVGLADVRRSLARRARPTSVATDDTSG